jgi:hypothetical protein
MLQSLKMAVRRNKYTYCLASTMYVLTKGVQSAWSSGLLRYIAKPYVNSKFTIIFYCYFPSHYQNIKGIPSLIKKYNSSAKVLLLTNYQSNEYFHSEVDDVKVVQGVNYHACRLLCANIFVTPMVGLSPCTVPFGAKSIHFLVSLAGLEGVYLDYHFDGWDYVFCASEDQVSDFIKLSQRRNIRGLTLIRGGYPKLDDQILSASKAGYTMHAKTVVYAPTHVYEGNSQLASLLTHGEDIVATLLDNKYTVIFRPHPASFMHSVDMLVIESICSRFNDNPYFTLDKSKDYTKTYMQAAAMVTDLSGTGFTYSLSLGRPSIFFSHNKNAECKLDGLHFKDRDRIGFVVRTVDELTSYLQVAIDESEKWNYLIMKYRENLIFNLGDSKNYFTSITEKIVNSDTVTNVEVL